MWFSFFFQDNLKTVSPDHGRRGSVSRVVMSDVNDAGQEVEVLLMEPRPFRPFKSSEEYLVAMKEDLAEWLGRLYHPQLEIDAENFMDVLEDGVVLCKVCASRRPKCHLTLFACT